MENKINIAELLKDCPKGMELDCASYDNVSFDKISDDKKATYPIFCYITDKEGNRSSISFTENGCESKRYGAKCVIFPKGKTTWEGFHRPFKDGDILATNDGLFIAIIKKNGGKYYCCCYKNGDYFITDYSGWFDRFATEEEKEKLFQAIKDNGYHWNNETKTLEELPKFKDGDVVVAEDSKSQLFLLKKYLNKDSSSHDGYCYFGWNFQNNTLFEKGNWRFDRLATEEERAKLFQTIKDNGYRWDEKTKILEKLSIFKVGDRIRHKDSGLYCTLGEYAEGISAYRTNIGLSIIPTDLEHWELVPDKPYFKVGDRIRRKNNTTIIKTIGHIYSDGYALYDGHLLYFKEQDEWELVPNKFDINTLKPFDQVLVRDFDDETWEINFFSRLLDNKHFKCLDLSYVQCIPYEGNEYLRGTTWLCKDYFKIWEK